MRCMSIRIRMEFRATGVVNRFGAVSPAFAFGGENRQIGLLEAEGIKVTDGIVDLKQYQWSRRSF